MSVNIFEPTANGYAGSIRHFGVSEALVLVETEPSDNPNAPDYRIHLDDEDGPEVGAGWKRVGQNAGNYIALEIESLLFFHTFRPKLFRINPDGEALRLTWKRSRDRAERD